MAKKKVPKKVSQAIERAPAEASGKTKPVRIELSEQQHALLTRLIGLKGGLSRGAYFRGLMLEDARKHGLLKKEEI
jgi:hypothetical protein